MKSVVFLLLIVVAILFGLGVAQVTLGDVTPMAKQVEPRITPRGPIAPEIASDTWLNSAPLAASELRGRVVLVEFWTFG